MKQKILPILFVVAFFTIILGVPGYWAFVDSNQAKPFIEENRSSSVFPSLSYKKFKKAVKLVLQGKTSEARTEFFNQIINRNFQKQVEKAVNDRFPFRLPAIKTSKVVDRKLIGLAYLFLDDPAIPADTQSDIYVLRDKSMLLSRPIDYDASTEKDIDERISNYETLIKLFPEQNFYAFYIQRILDSEFHPLNRYFPDADSGRGIQYFEDHLPGGLILEKLMLSSFEDQAAYSYKTDHHWNIRGACLAYDLLYTMLKQNYPEIPAKLKCDEYMILPDVRFLGSYARRTLYPIEPDRFEISTAKFPAYKMILGGKETPDTNRDDYLAGDFSRKKYENHYGEFYGVSDQTYEYVVEGNPPRDLLIIGSSFRRPLLLFLAACYRHTYVIDLRHVENFSLEKFLSANPVSDILIIGEKAVVYGSEEWFINP